MNRILLLIVLTIYSITGQAQTSTVPGLEPYFSAIIVKELDSSLDWYSKVLGYEIVDNNEYPEMNFKQANLKRGQSAIELIELGAAILPQDVIPNYNSKT